MTREKQLTILLLTEKLQKLTNRKVILEAKPIDFGVFKPKSSFEDKQVKYQQVLQKQVQDYIKNGSEGDLDLADTPITSLPDNLTTVGGDLYLSNTKITSLPDNLTVGGNLDLTDTPLSKKYTPKQLKKIYPGIKGNIYI